MCRQATIAASCAAVPTGQHSTAAMVRACLPSLHSTEDTSRTALHLQAGSPTADVASPGTDLAPSSGGASAAIVLLAAVQAQSCPARATAVEQCGRMASGARPGPTIIVDDSATAYQTFVNRMHGEVDRRASEHGAIVALQGAMRRSIAMRQLQLLAARMLTEHAALSAIPRGTTLERCSEGRSERPEIGAMADSVPASGYPGTERARSSAVMPTDSAGDEPCVARTDAPAADSALLDGTASESGRRPSETPVGAVAASTCDTAVPPEVSVSSRKLPPEYCPRISEAAP
jgi:hypothetical protein